MKVHALKLADPGSKLAMPWPSPALEYLAQLGVTVEIPKYHWVIPDNSQYPRSEHQQAGAPRYPEHHIEAFPQNIRNYDFQNLNLIKPERIFMKITFQIEQFYSFITFN